MSLLRHLRSLAAKNKVPQANFLGGGLQEHFIPSVTPHLALQSEFVTAYTPYQPEVSQGMLQATFEYQTMMSELTGVAGLERLDVRRRVGSGGGGALSGCGRPGGAK